FQRANIAALASDNPSLHLLVRQCNYRNGSFCYVISRTTLNGERDNIPSFLVALFLPLQLNLLDQLCRFMSYLLLYITENNLLRFLGRKRRDPFQLSDLL